MIGEKKYKSIIDNIEKNFKDAESKIKSAELLDQTISIPSINELRYAGHHILRATQLKEEDEILEELDKANRHTKRSFYDAVEASILYKLQKIENFDKEYKLIPETITVIDNYNYKLSQVSDIVQEIEDINIDSRDEKYKIIEDHYKTIKEINNEFQMSIPTIVNLIDKNEQTEKKEHRRFVLQLIMGAIAIIVTIAISK